MTLWIDKETRKRVNIYRPYKDFSKLNTPEIRERAGVIEIPEPTPPEDYSDDTYYVTSQDTEPYMVWTRKSDEQIAQVQDSRAKEAAVRHLNETDYLFTVDKYAQLTDERKADLTASREAARQIIRDYEAKYPQVV
jgi:hypothetical protein